MERIENRTFDEIKPGDTASLVRTLTHKDIELFAVMSGDINPTHLDDAFAKSDMFHKVVAHGGALISTVLGTQLPGPGTVYVDQSLHFLGAIGLGDTISISVKVRKKIEEMHRVIFDCWAVNQRAEEVITGTADVIAPTEKISRPRVVLPEVELRQKGRRYEILLKMTHGLDPIRTAVVHPVDAPSLLGAAARINLITPVLVGPKAKIRAAAAKLPAAFSMAARLRQCGLDEVSQDERDHFAGCRPCRHLRGARPRVRQHAGETTRVPRGSADGRHRARSAGADHSDQPLRRDARKTRILRDRASAGASQGGKAVSDAILVLNAGSSSIKFSVLPGHERPNRQNIICEGACEGIGHRVHFTAKDRTSASMVDEYLAEGTTHEDALAALLRWLEDHFRDNQLVAAGHRVVHGGSLYTAPVLIDASVTAELRRLIPLAPLHQPHNLAAIAAISKLHPTLPQIACFDTAFHHTQSEVATAFALPRRLAAEGIRRYGFHGLSYEYIASVLPDILGPVAADGCVVVAHLGSGASLCAIKKRKSVATTMGFTALDGLPMSRRCGNLDPGVILYLMQEKAMTATAVSNLLYNESGLFGVSGISDDIRIQLASQEPSAKEAVALFVYRIGRELGSMAAALGGVDALVFTAGIGEHAAEIRRRVCEDAAWLGVDLDQSENVTGGPLITGRGSRTSDSAFRQMKI